MSDEEKASLLSDLQAYVETEEEVDNTDDGVEQSENSTHEGVDLPEELDALFGVEDGGQSEGEDSTKDPFGKFKNQAEERKAYLEAQKKITEQAGKIKELTDIVGGIIQKAGVADETDLQLAQLEAELEEGFEEGMATVDANLTQRVVTGQLSPRDKVEAMAEYRAKLLMAQDKQRAQKRTELNLKQLERLQTTHQELLGIDAIRNASQHFIKSTLAKGEMLDPTETDNLFLLSKEIYNAGYEAGKKGDKSTAGDIKKRMQSMNPAGGGKARTAKELDINSVDTQQLDKVVKGMSDKQFDVFRKKLGFEDYDKIR